MTTRVPRPGRPGTGILVRWREHRRARHFDGIRLIAFWQALGDDTRAEKAAATKSRKA